jgi:glycosyltransferase involved in cell wall biosynthesis
MVSVIIPCYNGGLYLREAIDSVKNQTIKDIEIIVIDDCSNDQLTKEVISGLKNDKTIKTLQNFFNRGVSASRNRAISEAKGIYIVPLDADDRLHPEFVEKAVKAIENSRGDVIYSQFELFGNRKCSVNLKMFSVKKMLHDNLVVNTALYRKSAWSNVCGYSEEMKTGLEDWDFWLSLIEKGNDFHRIEESLFYYRKHGESRKDNAKKTETELRKIIFDRHSKLYAMYGIYLPPPKLRNKTENPAVNLAKRVTYNSCINILRKNNRKDHINIYYYNPPRLKNFGDQLNQSIIEKITGRKVKFATVEEATYTCIGSILENLLLKPGEKFIQKPVNIWGSGFICPVDMHPKFGKISINKFKRPIIVHAVRGKITRARLSEMGYDVKNCVLGDPGLLAGTLFCDQKIKKIYRLGFVSHYADNNKYLSKIISQRIKGAKILNILDEPKKFICDLSKCEVVISSAMHGLIAADSLGIPNARAIISNNITGGNYKYNDYYSIYGTRPRVMNIDDIIKISNKDIEQITLDYTIKKEDVLSVVNNLLKACPFLTF